MAVGRRTLYRAYYARPDGHPDEKEDLVVGILTDELRRSKNIAKSHGKFSSPILKAPTYLQRLGLSLAARLKTFKRPSNSRCNLSEEEAARYLPGITDPSHTNVHTDDFLGVTPGKKKNNFITSPRLAAALDQANQLPILTFNHQA